MKKLTKKNYSLISLGCIVLSIFFVQVIISCTKQKQESSTAHQLKTIDYLNYFRPDVDYTTLKAMLDNFRFKIEAFRASEKIEFQDESAEQARYEMETTIMNDNAGVIDSLHNYTLDTLYFQVDIKTIDDHGIPILDGTSITQEFTKLQDSIIAINRTSFPLSFISIQIISFDHSYTYFYAALILTQGSFSGMPVVLRPNQTPEPFESNEWAPAFFDGTYEGANSRIQKKLNANNPAYYPKNTIIEVVNPPFFSSYLDDYSSTYWHAFCNEILFSTDLNTYLGNYKQDLDDHNSPYGFNDQYIHDVIVTNFNGWTACYPQVPCWPEPPNSQIYDWHSMVMNRVQFHYVGGQTK
jgi:hypothetical protein